MRMHRLVAVPVAMIVISVLAVSLWGARAAMAQQVAAKPNILFIVSDDTGYPHVTIGLAPQDYLKKMLDEKFESFTFSPAGASVYHLGNFGTARVKFNTWESHQ